jgi:phage/plasmid-like protein (TIGR03299 family)
MELHQLGVEMPLVATSEEAIERAGLDWEVGMTPIYMNVGQQDNSSFTPVPSYNAIYRKDTGESLGIAGGRYTPFQNRHAFAMLDSTTEDPGGPKYEVVGSFRGGRMVWALLRVPTDIIITPNDVVNQYLLAVNCHDGTHSFSIQYVPRRFVCSNGLQMALRQASYSFKARHTENIATKVHEAQQVLGIVKKTGDYLREVYPKMLEYHPSETELTRYLNDLLSVPEPAPAGAVNFDELADIISTRKANQVMAVRQYYHEGPGQAEVVGTAWGAYNSMTGWVDNVRPSEKKSVEDNAYSTWFGSGARIKEQAFEKTLDMMLGKYR